MSQKMYLQLDYKSGNLFEYSKEPQEGFEKHVSKTGKESYRKYHKYGFEGTLNSVSVRDSDFGKQLSLAFEEGTYINFGLLDSKGNVDQFAESVIKVLPQLNKNDKVKISPFNFIPEGEKYAKTGVSVSINGEKTKGLTNAYYKDGKLVKGDVPAIVWKDNPLGGKKPSAASMEERNDYLLGVLTKEAERLKWEGNGSTEGSHTTEYNGNQEDMDSLPF